MKAVKITVLKKAEYLDLIALYENPIKNACNLCVGQEFVVKNCQKPDGMCDSAWETLFSFVEQLANGGGDFFDGWMKNEKSAMLSCNDGFRPVTFYLEVIK